MKHALIVVFTALAGTFAATAILLAMLPVLLAVLCHFTAEHCRDLETVSSKARLYAEK